MSEQPDERDPPMPWPPAAAWPWAPLWPVAGHPAEVERAVLLALLRAGLWRAENTTGEG